MSNVESSNFVKFVVSEFFKYTLIQFLAKLCPCSDSYLHFNVIMCIDVYCRIIDKMTQAVIS